MAEFLDTAGVTHRLQKIITDAQERLFLISPYLKFNKLIKDRLADKDKFRIDIRVIYGKNDLQPAENQWLDSLTSVRTSFRENLHAKCYLNENEAIVTSMNLYEFSQQNNDEMGILVSKHEDPALYEDIRKEAERIERGSQGVRVTVSMEQDKEAPVSKAKKVPSESSLKAFCIRCGTDIPANPAKPYCGRDFKIWNRFKNEDFEEKCCHTCGKEHEATMKKPVCLSCYRKYKDVLELAAS